MRIDCWVDNVRRHDRFNAFADQDCERHQIVDFERRERSRITRHLVMRIGGDKTVAGKVLGDRSDSACAKAAAKCAREMSHCVRIAMESAVSDYFTVPVIEIEHRCKAEVDAMRA